MTVVLSYVPSPEGRGALAFGFAEARMRGTRVLVVPDPGSTADPSFVTDLEDARAGADAGAVDYDVAELDPELSHSDQLIDASYGDEVDLVVIGIRRRSPVGKLFTGSAMQRVLLDAHSPVVAVKPPVRAAL